VDINATTVVCVCVGFVEYWTAVECAGISRDNATVRGVVASAADRCVASSGAIDADVTAAIGVASGAPPLNKLLHWGARTLNALGNPLAPRLPPLIARRSSMCIA
jgi:hypothetical protein